MAVTASFVADFSSFYDAVDQANVKLREFDSGANKVEASLSRMVDSFSGRKLIQEATLMAEAIERLDGGLSSLSDAELQKVSATAAQAVEKMQALGMDVPANLQQLADATAGVGKENESLSVSVGTLVQSYLTAEAAIKVLEAVYTLLVGTMKDAVLAAVDAEETDTKLLATLQAQGTAMPSVLSAYEGYARALQDTTTYSAGAVKATAQLLAQVGGVMPRDMEKALKATTDLAAGLGKDLPEAAMIVAKAAQGNTTALEKYRVSTVDAKGETLAFDQVLTNINTTYGGMAEMMGNTLAGSVKQFGNSWADVQESLGRVITSNESVRTLMKGLNELLKTNTGELNSNATVNNLVSDAAVLVAQSLKLAAEGINIFQKELRDGRVFVDIFAKQLSYLYAGLLAIETFTQKGLAWAGSEEAALRVKEAGDNAKWAAGQIRELDADIANANQSSKDWSAGLAAFQTNVDGVIVRIKAQRGETSQLTATQQENVNAILASTENVTAHADAVKKAHDEAVAAAEKQAAAWVELATVGETYQQTLAGMNDATVQSIARYLEAGASQSTLAAAYGVTASQVKAVAMMLKEEQAAYDLSIKQKQALNRIELELQRAMIDGSKSVMDNQIANIHATAQAQLTAMELAGTATAETYAAMEALTNQLTENVIRKNLEADEGTQASYAKRLKDAELYYNQVITYSHQYTSEQIADAAAAVDAAASDLNNWANLANQTTQSVAVGATSAAAAVRDVTTAFQGLSAVQSGATIPLPQGPAYTGDLVPQFGAGGYLGMGPATPADLGVPVFGAGGFLGRKQVGFTLNMGPGAVTMNYPVMNDPQAMDQIANVVGNAVMNKVSRSGGL